MKKCKKLYWKKYNIKNIYCTPKKSLIWKILGSVKFSSRKYIFLGYDWKANKVYFLLAKLTETNDIKYNYTYVYCPVPKI